MSIPKIAVNRPTTVVIIFTILAALGMYTLVDLPLDLLPDIELPFVAISTTYPGAGPEEVERRITRPLESTISGVSGIEYLTSTSSYGQSLVYMQLTFGTNLDEAMNDIRSRLDYIKNMLPADAATPLIFKMDPNMIPIMFYSISGNRSPEELRDYADDIIPRLEQIDGVASAFVSGGREKAIIVEIPRDRLQAYNLTISQISQLMSAQNQQIAGGTITEQELNYSISTAGEYRSIEDIKNTVISYKMTGSSVGPTGLIPGSLATIRLRDIADVYEGFKEIDSLHYMNGVPAVRISIQKQSGKNSVQTARAVKARMEEIISDAPSDIIITQTGDTTEIIERSVSNVSFTAIQGAILAVIVLFIFLRSFRSTLIIGLTIPISLVLTLGVMFFSGMTLNIMTLAGLALGVGMLVDNSIVILENIFSYREKGAKPVSASILGAQEMTMAITASTLTTICVFLPLLMYRRQLGLIGEIFQGLAFTVVISLVCSLVVALVLVPVLSSKYLKLGSKREKELERQWRIEQGATVEEKKTTFFGRCDEAMGRFFSRLDNAYASTVRKILHHKFITLLIIGVMFVMSLIMIPVVGFVYMPEQASDSVQVSLNMPVGTSLEATESVLRQLEQIVYQQIQGYTNVTILVGSTGMFGFGASGSHVGELTINLPRVQERVMDEEEIREILRSHFHYFPGATFSIGAAGGMNLGGGNAAISISVKTDDMDKGRATAQAILTILKSEASDLITDPQIDLKDGLPQVNIIVDRDRLYNLGLNIFSVGQEIRANIAGVTATRYRQNGVETDIQLMLAREDRARLTDLEQIFVTNAQGLRVPVSSFAHYEEGVSPISINREGQSRIIRVTAGAMPGVQITTIQPRIEELILQGIPLEEDVQIEFGGDFEDLMEALNQFAVIILMAAILVFGVMASQFESLIDPFIVLFTLPLSVVGIVIIFGLMGTPLNILTAVGLLILVGIIVNNGIVLVDYTNLLRKRGLNLTEACVESARSRLRPILMTTLTTVLGLTPMAFLPGEGSELVQPIGQTVLGGLAFGTLMTLFLMPVLYYGFNRWREQRAEKHAARLSIAATGGEG